MAVTMASAIAGVLAACDDDSTGGTGAPDSGAIDSGGKDSGSSGSTDSGSDASTTDTGSDAQQNGDTGADAGPVLTSSVGSTGSIQIRQDAVFAEFYEDDVILRWSNAPDCVAHVRSRTKPQSQAGTLTVGGPIVGSDGGTDQAITVTPDPMLGYVFIGPVFPFTDALNVELSGTSTVAFPGIPVQTLEPSAAAEVVVSKPVLPDSGDLKIPHTSAFDIAWTAPGSGTANKKIAFVLSISPTSAIGAKVAILHCAFPLAAGQASVPANILADLRDRATAGTGTTNPTGFVHVFAGAKKEIAITTTSYVVEAARIDSTSLHDNFNVELQ